MKPFVATIGFFDGVHIAHQMLINQVINIAKTENMNSLLLTFDYLPKSELGLLTPIDEKIQILNNFELDEIRILNFDEIKNLSPEEFLIDLFKNYKIKKVIVGENFKFGKGKTGDIDTLISFSKKYSVEIIPFKTIKYKIAGKKCTISSSLIRTLIKNGKIESANELLGRRYSIEGKIVSGKKIGKKIGFPTVNISTEDNFKLLPIGVFFTNVCLNNNIYIGLTNIGRNPTISNRKDISIETYILNFSKEITQGKIKISFVSKIRDEKKFDNIMSLREQIKKDVKNIVSSLLYNSYNDFKKNNNKQELYDNDSKKMILHT